jgi:hypothetical protein
VLRGYADGCARASPAIRCTDASNFLKNFRDFSGGELFLFAVA